MPVSRKTTMSSQRVYKNLSEYVNPLIGTDSANSFSHGNIYPAISMPFGMTAWTPQTGEKHDGWIYQYKKQYINGFKATHQPSPWIGDYGDFAIMPVLGNKDDIPISISERKTAFKHKNETAHPYYYGVGFENGINVEFTPTERCCYMQISYPESYADDAVPCLILDNWGLGDIKKINDSRIVGTAEHSTGAVPDNFACYFIVELNRPFNLQKQENGIAVLTFPNPPLPPAPRLWRTGNPLPGGEQKGLIQLKIGTSFISSGQAVVNLDREIGDCCFEHIKEKGKNIWNSILSKVQIKRACERQLKTFYSVFYRTKLFPRIFYEFDKEEKIKHYSPYNGKVEDGILYTDNGFWDTYRTVYPLFSIISPEHDANIIQGWINACREGGWFPKWASPGYRECMIGTPMVNIITDALYKGIDSFDIEKAYAGCRRDALDSSGGYSFGRRELDSYTKLGYCPMDVVKESTSRTLEYAYNDFCMAEFAGYLRKDEDYRMFSARAHNYKNVFDSADKFMKGRYSDGSWEKDFSPIKWGGPKPPGGPYTEGNSWQYTFAVPYDVAGLIDLIGGDEAFIAKLDALLEPENNKFEVGYYDKVIHEMAEMVACSMGQYEHNNQPVHQMLYMYNYAGVPWKAAPHIRKVVDEFYSSGPDGFCGDEDNGELSSWYIFSVLGFYPVCPGSSVPRYEIGTPRFDEVTIELPNSKSLIITANNNSDQNIFVRSVKVNGEKIERSWFKHEEIVNGGIIEFEMSCVPNKGFGKRLKERPPSMV